MNTQIALAFPDVSGNDLRAVLTPFPRLVPDALISSGEIAVRSESMTALSSVSGTTVTPSPFARTTETEEDGICGRSIEA